MFWSSVRIILCPGESEIQINVTAMTSKNGKICVNSKISNLSSAIEVLVRISFAHGNFPHQN